MDSPVHRADPARFPQADHDAAARSRSSATGRPGSLPLEDRVLLVAAYWRTNLTLRQLAPLFGVSKSAVDRIVARTGPLLALKQRARFRKGTVLIVDGTLVPRDAEALPARPCSSQPCSSQSRPSAFRALVFRVHRGFPYGCRVYRVPIGMAGYHRTARDTRGTGRRSATRWASVGAAPFRSGPRRRRAPSRRGEHRVRTDGRAPPVGGFGAPAPERDRCRARCPHTGLDSPDGRTDR